MIRRRWAGDVERRHENSPPVGDASSVGSSPACASFLNPQRLSKQHTEVVIPTKTKTEYGWADWVFIISILILLLWIIGKSIGVIQSPIYIDMIPYLSIVFSAGALFQKIREMDKNIVEIKGSLVS